MLSVEDGFKVKDDAGPHGSGPFLHVRGQHAGRSGQHCGDGGGNGGYVFQCSGVKDYVDTTGNIMVDIADGIGMVSKGIEALEYWLDPGAETKPTEPGESAEPTPPSAAPESAPPSPSPGQQERQEADPSQPKVFCQKGKCYPYDPAKLRNPNINLEMKPGMILTPAQTPPQPQEQHQKGKQNQKRRHRKHQEEEEEEGEARNKGDSTPL